MKWFPFLFAASLWAANDIAVVPTDDMPLITIADYEVVDLSQLQPGDPVTFDVYFTNVDFHFAGAEFRIFFPRYILNPTLDPTDQTGDASVFVPGPLFDGGRAVQLPVDTQGQSTSPIDFAPGIMQLGLVFTGSAHRWKGSPTAPHPGGKLGRLHFFYNPGAVPTCISRIESVAVTIGMAHQDGRYDYFSDANGDRVQLVEQPPRDVHHQIGVAAHIGHPAALLKADADNSGSRGLEDTLANAHCVFYGWDYETCPTYWRNNTTQAEQVFDFDCSGQVGLEDILGNSRWVFYGRIDPYDSSTSTKAGLSFALEDKQRVTLNLPNVQAPLAMLRFRVDGDVKLKLKDGKRDWRLITTQQGKRLEVMLFHKGKRDTPLPSLELRVSGRHRAAVKVRRAVALTAKSQRKPLLITLESR